MTRTSFSSLCLVLTAVVVITSLDRATAATSCSAYGYKGTCMATSSCTSQGGGSVTGFCPGSSDNQCCLQVSCNSPRGTGKCQSTSVSSQCQGFIFSNLCPGPSSFKCCFKASAGPKADQIVDLALRAANGNAMSGWSGGKIPYSWGGGHGSSPGPSLGTCSGYTGSIRPCPADKTKGVDCSGFTRWIYALAYGRDVLGSGNAQSQAARLGQVGNPQRGDLVFFGSDFHHVGIYIGNGQMVDAPYTGAVVQVDAVSSGVQGYYRPT